VVAVALLAIGVALGAVAGGLPAVYYRARPRFPTTLFLVLEASCLAVAYTFTAIAITGEVLFSIAFGGLLTVVGLFCLLIVLFRATHGEKPR